MGVMTAFGSYNPIKQDIATDEKVIAFLDVFASIMSGFVVYGLSYSYSQLTLALASLLFCACCPTATAYWDS